MIRSKSLNEKTNINDIFNFIKTSEYDFAEFVFSKYDVIIKFSKCIPLNNNNDSKEIFEYSIPFQIQNPEELNLDFIKTYLKKIESSI